jgi:fumarate reductase iron-sulfur subunit
VSARPVELEVLRYHPEKDREPHFQRYSVECPEEWVVLDALNHVKETVDPTLSYRWSCHMAVCGSCGMMINGEPKLACKTFLRDYRQTPAQLKRYKQFTLCINCMLCYAACPEYGIIPKFIGPAALSLAHRYNADSRDGGREARRDEVAAYEGVWECSFTGACSEVCPEHVDPAAALQQEKIENTLDWYQAHLMPWLKK